MKKDKSKSVGVLTPKKLPDGRWQVSLGITSVNGRRKNPRKQFKTRADALEFCNAEKRRKRAHGEITAGADGSKVVEWMKVDTMMESAGVQLSDVRSWIDLDSRLREAGGKTLTAMAQQAVRDMIAVKKHGTVVECYTAWLSYLDKMGRRGRYLENGRNYCTNFIYGDIAYRGRKQHADGKEVKGWRGFGEERQTLEITPRDIEAYIQYHPGYYGVLSAWLGWAAKERWLAENPCTGKKPHKAERGGVVTLTNEQTKKLLRNAAKSKDWVVLTYLVVALFGTIRPAEFRKVAKGYKTEELCWEDIKSDGLEVSPELSKTGSGRVVELEPVLKKWIDYIRSRRGEELVGPMPNKNWCKHWKSWRADHWTGKWPQDLLRHTYGSNHLARSQSLDVTSRIMGNSPAILQRHYWNWQTRKQEAEAYWNLSPEVVLDE